MKKLCRAPGSHTVPIWGSDDFRRVFTDPSTEANIAVGPADARVTIQTCSAGLEKSPSHSDGPTECVIHARIGQSLLYVTENDHLICAETDHNTTADFIDGK